MYTSCCSGLCETIDDSEVQGILSVRVAVRPVSTTRPWSPKVILLVRIHQDVDTQRYSEHPRLLHEHGEDSCLGKCFICDTGLTDRGHRPA